jgi:hypothetical protein
MPSLVELNVDDAPLGAVSVWADGVDPQPGGDAKSLHHDLVVHGAHPGVPEHTTIDVSYAAPQAYKIVNVALHRKYS